MGVLVDLERTAEAGGHVKCWERIAEAACDREGTLELSVHFLASEDAIVPLASNVRLVHHRPRLSTTRLRFLGELPGPTDLAWSHAGLRRYLPGYEVIHTADAYFAFARTALRHAKRTGTPLVSSTHTDVPQYTRVFTAGIVEALLGGPAGDRLRLGERAGAWMERRLDRYLARCDHVLGSSPRDVARARRLLPPDRVSGFRRGVEKERFHPRLRDRAALAQRFGLSPDRPVVLYVGRLDAAKSPLVLARALRGLSDRGIQAHALFVGAGPERGAIDALLGPSATLAGALPQGELPSLYASADLFVLPSRTELFPNVVLEAKSAGLPVILSTEGGAAQLVHAPGVDGALVSSEDPGVWADAMTPLIRDPAHREAMGRAARADIEDRWPTWSEVLAEDLLPVWTRVSGR